MPRELCRACGQRPIRSDNRSGRCVACWKAKRSTRECACGCGRMLNVRNRHGLSRGCRMRLAQRITEKLAELAERADDPIARNLFEAAVAFAERRYSALRAAAFESALLAFGASSAETLLTCEEPPEGSN
jgi:hypothetical protein